MHYFPRYVTNNYLWWNKKEIEMIDCENGDRYYKEVHCAKRKDNVVKLEKYIGKGWYEYAKKKKLHRGDTLGFTIRSSPYRLWVYIITYGRYGACGLMRRQRNTISVAVCFESKHENIENNGY